MRQNSHRLISFYRVIIAELMTANGPAIKGGCVTRRKHPAVSWYFSQKAVTVQGGYGALFAVMVQILLSIMCVAVQVCWEPRIYPRLQGWLRALAQCRGTSCLGATNLSRCRNLIAGRCACPGATALRVCLECRSKSKKCDKQLTFIVRVRFSLQFFLSG